MWTHELLRASDWNERRHFDWMYAHAKFDGIRVTCFKQPTGQVHLLTTEGNDLWTYVRDYPWYLNMLRKVPCHTSVDCELWVPGLPASEVKSSLAKRDGRLQLMPFAVPFFRGTSAASMRLDEVESLCRGWSLSFAPYFIYTEQPTRDELCARAVAQGWEGWVLKASNYDTWYKVKPVRTIDAVVTGFKDGDGKYLGLIGALQVSVEGHAIAWVSGMDDMTRCEIDEDKDLGRVVEVAYQYVGAKGRLRHPRFVRWRDDKSADACTLDQDAQLATYWRA